jgi:galactosamine-6-phosphate isomerase
MEQEGPIDVCILGIGLNGHIALNEPAPTLSPYAHVAELAEQSRKHVMLKQTRGEVQYGLTLGVADILRARKILLLVSSAAKKDVLARLLTARVTTDFPASLLWLHRDVTILCDREAAGE